MRVVLVRSRAIDPAAMKIAQSLKDGGYEVCLLLWDRTGISSAGTHEDPVVWTLKVPAPYDRLSVLLLMPLWWAYEFVLLLRMKPDVVHACDLDTLLPAIASKLILHHKLCYSVFDFYASNLPPGTPDRLREIVANLERASLQSVDVLFLPHECRYEQVAGARIRKLVYLYNSPPDCPKLRGRLLLHESTDLVVFYAGVLHKSRGIRLVIEAIANLEHIMLVVAGSGPDEAFVREIEVKLPGRVLYIGQVPYRRVLEETSSADVLIALYDPAVPNTKFASPNKLFEAMMCGKPIIMNAEAAASSIVKDEDCGIVVPYGDPAAIRRAMQHLIGDRELRRKLGLNGRKAYEAKYNWGIMRARLLSAYQAFGPRVTS